MRAILEGSRAVTWTDGWRLTPTLELGGRVSYADPTLGLTVEGLWARQTTQGLLSGDTTLGCTLPGACPSLGYA